MSEDTQKNKGTYGATSPQYEAKRPQACDLFEQYTYTVADSSWFAYSFLMITDNCRVIVRWSASANSRKRSWSSGNKATLRNFGSSFFLGQYVLSHMCQYRIQKLKVITLHPPHTSLYLSKIHLCIPRSHFFAKKKNFADNKWHFVKKEKGTTNLEKYSKDCVN